MHLKDILKSFLPLLVILVLPETSAGSIKDQLDNSNDQKAANETKITQTKNSGIDALSTLLPYHLMEYASRNEC